MTRRTFHGSMLTSHPRFLPFALWPFLLQPVGQFLVAVIFGLSGDCVSVVISKALMTLCRSVSVSSIFMRTRCCYPHPSIGKRLVYLLENKHNMTAKQLTVIASDEQVRKRLAKLMAQQCFRNTELENLHAGTTPNSKSGRLYRC